LPVELDTSAYACLLWQQAEYRERGLRLARPGLSDKANRLAALDRKIRTIDHGIVTIANGQPPYGKKAHSACLASK
jgi:hypothetical protein